MGEAVIEEFLGVVPLVFAVEDDELEFAAIAGDGGGVGVAGVHRPAGFGGAHAVIFSEQFIVVIYNAGTGLRGEMKFLGAADGAKFGDGYGRLEDFQQIGGGGVLALHGQAIGAFEGGVGAAELLGAGVHEGKEGGDGTAGVAGERHGGVVVGADEQRVNQVVDGDRFARDERDVAGLDLGVGFFDSDGAVQAAVFVNEEGGEQLDGARGGMGRGGVFLVEDGSGGGVEQQGAVGINLGGGRSRGLWRRLGRTFCWNGDGQRRERQQKAGEANAQDKPVAGGAAEFHRGDKRIVGRGYARGKDIVGESGRMGAKGGGI